MDQTQLDWLAKLRHALSTLWVHGVTLIEHIDDYHRARRLRDAPTDDDYRFVGVPADDRPPLDEWGWVTLLPQIYDDVAAIVRAESAARTALDNVPKDWIDDASKPVMERMSGRITKALNDATWWLESMKVHHFPTTFGTKVRESDMRTFVQTIETGMILEREEMRTRFDALRGFNRDLQVVQNALGVYKGGANDPHRHQSPATTEPARSKRDQLLLRLGEGEDFGIELGKLQKGLLDANLLTVCDADGLIEFGHRNYWHEGGGEHAELRVGNMWEFAGIANKPQREPMKAFLAEALDPNADPRLRIHVKLTPKGRTEASRIRLVRTKQKRIRPTTGVAGDQGQQPIVKDKDWPTVTVVSKLFHVSTGTVSRWCDANELKFNGKKGRDRRIRPESVIEKGKELLKKAEYQRLLKAMGLVRD